jgi:hypothetical protein
MSVVGKFLISAALALSAAFAGNAALAAEPTVDQVYQAAQAGRYIEAQGMLDEVLKAHPTSAKAHYIQAQVYARQGMLNKAKDELASADKLDPAGKYASPASVKELRDLIAARPAVPALNTQQSTGSYSPPAVQQRLPQPAQPERGFPWGIVFIGVGLVAFIVWVTRMMNRRAGDMMQQQPQAPQGGGMFGGYNNGGNMQSYPGGAYGGGGGYGPGYGPAPAPGMGSRIMGGLATGAAVGAGIVAGEAIARQFTHDDSRNANAATSGGDSWSNNSPAPSNYDMGGNDFGVSDSSSWDSGGGGGGDGGGGGWD